MTALSLLAKDLREAAGRAKEARGGVVPTSALVGAAEISASRVRDMRLTECEALLRLMAILLDDDCQRRENLFRRDGSRFVKWTQP